MNAPLQLCVDRRIYGCPRYYFGNGEPLMFVPDVIRDCVAFIRYQSVDRERYGGTVFFVLMPLGENYGSAYYAVTAKHVIDGVRKWSIDQKASMRINTTAAGVASIETDCSDWIFHHTDSSVDVAVLPMRFPLPRMDHRFLSAASFADPEIRKHAQISIGEEVFLAGLFKSHPGTKRNIPIIRVGNIAAMPSEPITTKLGEIEAYLIEARSIGGLSGSPVFATTQEHLSQYLPSLSSTVNPSGANVASTATISIDEILGPERRMMAGPNAVESFCLLGLMHGHFNADRSDADAVAEDATDDQLNTGIGIVVPAEKIMEVLENPILQEQRRKAVEEIEKSMTATPDSV